MYYLNKMPILFSGQGGASFVPTDIANCVLWLDASDASTITETSGSVSQWNDKSGLGNNATQGTGAQQPTTGARSQNGLNVLDFDGGDRLALPSGLYSVSAGPNTMFVVWATDSTSNNQRLVAGFTVADGTRYGFMLNDPSSGSFTVRNNSGGVNLTQSVTFDTNAHVSILRRNGTSLENFYDGTSVSSTGAADYTMNNMWIGASNTVNFPLNGMIAEVLIYTDDLSDPDKDTVENYLISKWGL